MQQHFCPAARSVGAPHRSCWRLPLRAWVRSHSQAEPLFAPADSLPGLSAPAHAQSINAARPVGFADIVEKVKPAVMSVRVKMDAGPQLSSDNFQMPQRPGLAVRVLLQALRLPRWKERPRHGRPGAPNRHNFTMGQGSGFFISPDGYAVTNNHVVDKAETVEVTTDEGKTYTAKVIGTDPRTDLALIKIDGRSDFPYVQLADAVSAHRRLGAGGRQSVRSRRHRHGRHRLGARSRHRRRARTTTSSRSTRPVNKGNSGGPTFDVDGNVIGVNTAIFSPSGGSIGIAFDIPADTVKTVVAQLKDKGAVTRGWLGVQIQPVTTEIADSMGLKSDKGALVAEPQANSPAVKAGIKSGDVITKVNGEPVNDARTLGAPHQHAVARCLGQADRGARRQGRRS